MSTQYKRTHWVQRREDFSSGCSSGFFALGPWLLASLFALFAGINRCLQPSVPMGANASVGNCGAGALKSPFFWRDRVSSWLCVAVILMIGSIFSPVSARDFTCNATIDLQVISASYTPSDWDSSCSGMSCDREKKCKADIESKFFNSSLWDKLNPTLTGEQKHQLCKQGNGSFRVSYGFDKRKKEWNFTKSLGYSSSNCPVPNITFQNGTRFLCSGNTATLITNEAPEGYGYQWYKDGNPISQAKELEVSSTGEYQVSYTFDGYAFDKSEAISITQCGTCPSIGGKVWHDINGNGVRDNYKDGKIEPFLEGVTVYSYDLFSIGTNQNGEYSFQLNKTGIGHHVGIKNPIGIKITQPSELSHYIKPQCESINNLDFGIRLPASISGKVWNDFDCDGKMDTGESGLDDWQVWLKYESGTDKPEWLELTYNDGNYQFDDLYFPGQYNLYVKPEIDSQRTFPTAPNYIINLEKYDVVEDMNFGYCPPKIEIGNNFCITGKSTGIGYSWKLKKTDGSFIPPTGYSNASGVAAGENELSLQSDFVQEIYNQMSEFPTYNQQGCFAFSNIKELWVGKHGQNPNCEIIAQGSNGCTFNPTIRLVKSSPDTALSISQISHEVAETSDTISIEIANTGTGPIMGWVAEANDSWLSIERGDHGENNGTITVRYDANSGEERTGTITVVAPGAENGPQTVEVTQASKPLPKWDRSLEGYKFIDTNNNGKYDASESLVKGRHYIVMKPLSYAGSPFGALADNGHYKFYNLKNGTYQIWQDIDSGWLADNLTTEAEIKWSSDDPLTISVSDDGVRIDGSNQLLDKIDFPIPDFANQSSNIIPQDVKDNITEECENVDYVFCGIDSPNDCLSSSAKFAVIDLTTTGQWPTADVYSDIKKVFATKKLSTFGTIYLPPHGNNQNVVVGSICNHGTLTLQKDDYYYHPVVMDFNYWFINYGTVRGASAVTKWFWNLGQLKDIERIEIRSKAPWGGLSGDFYNEGTIQGGIGKRFNYTGEKSLNAKAVINNKELIGFPQLKDLLQLNNLSVFKNDFVECTDTGYTDGSLEANKFYDYTQMPAKAALGAVHFKSGACYTYPPNSLEPTDALSTGGNIRIEAANIWQNGNIEAGQGMGMNFQKENDVPFRFNQLRFGGKGGDTVLRSPNMVFTKNSTTRAGKGGDITIEEPCLTCVNIEIKGGQGGNLTIDPASDESNIRIYGMLEGDSIYVEPDLMLAGKDTNIVARQDIVIFGGDNWNLVLNDLRNDAIVAGRDITLAVGEGGTVDLRSNTSKVFKAGGKVTIHADNVLLDQGVQLEDIIQANEIVQGPNKIIYRVVLDTQDVQGKANETIPVKLEISNAGPKEDTYTLSAVSKNGFAISGLPSSVTIEGLTREQLDLSVILPEESGDIITITAISQADPTVSATAKIRASIVQETTAEFSISETSGIVPLTVDLDASASVANGIIVSYKWTASDGQTAEGQNAQLTFNEIGDYTITLEVMDDRETTDSATQKVKVEAAGNYVASGTLKDKEGNPLAGVTIQIGDKTTVTDAAGNWKIDGLPEGEYPVTANKDGYRFDTTPCVVSNNVDTCQPKIKGEPLLDVKVLPEPRIAKQGENVTYRITVTNQGEGTATDVTLVNALPNQAELLKLVALDGGNCDEATLTCQLPELTPGATANLELVVSNHLAETLVNTVTVTTQEYPTEVKKTWTPVMPYLSVTLVDQPDPVTMLNTLDYRLTVTLNQYAPSDATGVTVVSQLPQGVELKSIKSDDGVCDTSTSSQITCQLNDLSIASADSISQATVEMEVQLTDGGLLLLTHQAKVTANEYPAHQIYEPTTIFIPEEIQVDLALVIDITGSMQDEMNGVIAALKEFIAQIDSSQSPLMTLITFGDQVKVTAFTRDIDVLRGAIEDLTASGGGLCEEASVEALLVAIPHTKAEGDILFATDASPYPEADVEKVLDLLKDKAIHFNAFITGDCSMEESWNTLPQ
jgi:uncharacterized repeat protein (TIGR01451 family)